MSVIPRNTACVNAHHSMHSLQHANVAVTVANSIKQSTPDQESCELLVSAYVLKKANLRFFCMPLKALWHGLRAACISKKPPPWP
jgi:hypothetical protein